MSNRKCDKGFKCYVSKFKHGINEKKRSIGALAIAVVALSLIITTGFLAYNFEAANPTALDSSLAQQTIWKDASGNTLGNGAKITGTISVRVNIPYPQVAEYAKLHLSMGYTQQDGSCATPYYVAAVEEYIYMSDGTFVNSFALTPLDSTYLSGCTNWIGSWAASVLAGFNQYGSWWKGTIPTETHTSVSWTGELDTRTLAKGSYTIYTCISWVPVGTKDIWLVPQGTLKYITYTFPEPPSLSGASWHNLGALWLSSLTTSEEGGEGPVVGISANCTSGDPPLAVHFSSTVSPGPSGLTDYSYNWNFGDGQTSTEAAPSHVFTDVGYYQVQLKVTDGSGASTVKSLTIMVGNPMPPVEVSTVIVVLVLLGLIIVVVIKRR